VIGVSGAGPKSAVSVLSVLGSPRARGLRPRGCRGLHAGAGHRKEAGAAVAIELPTGSGKWPSSSPRPPVPEATRPRRRRKRGRAALAALGFSRGGADRRFQVAQGDRRRSGGGGAGPPGAEAVGWPRR
jgi:hypothetical protein